MAWSELLAIRLPRGLSGTAGSALDTVLSAVTDRPLPGGRNGIVPDSGWRASIDGRSVAIVGPAPSRHLAAEYDLRAGIANLALLGDKEGGLGHDQLVYLNNETWATHPRAEILASVDDGLYAANFGGGQVDITSGKFVFSASEAWKVEKGKLVYPVKGATLIGNGPDALTRVTMIGNDLALDTGIGTCGKEGQSVPVGVGQPTLKIEGLTVGGTA